MRLATLDDGTRDGQLVVVGPKGDTFASAAAIAPNLQTALDDWEKAAAPLRQLADELGRGGLSGEPLPVERLRAPLPRAYEWIDGSAYINHIVLVRKARGAEPPETLQTDPLVYQGGSGVLLGPRDPIAVANFDWGCDFEAEICVILDDTPRGTTAAQAGGYVRLLTLANDVSLRNLIPSELAKGFGFFTSKPATAFSPFAVTPDELGEAWKDGRVHLPLQTTYNGTRFGDPQAGPEMHFSFYDLIEHVTKTRSLTAGTILGSGTVSNEDRSKGSSCLAEKRMIEKIDTGEITTPFMQAGDTVEIKMIDNTGRDIFGTISQEVVPT